MRTLYSDIYATVTGTLEALCETSKRHTELDVNHINLSTVKEVMDLWFRYYQLPKDFPSTIDYLVYAEGIICYAYDCDRITPSTFSAYRYFVRYGNSIKYAKFKKHIHKHGVLLDEDRLKNHKRLMYYLHLYARGVRPDTLFTNDSRIKHKFKPDNQSNKK